MAPRVNTETYAGTVAGAVAGLVQWIIATYAFGGNMPAPVTTAVYILIPAAVAGVTGFLTRRSAKQPVPASPPAAESPPVA